MIAVAVRRFRQESIGTVLALVAIGLLALVTGTMMSNEFHHSGLAECLTTPGSDCERLRDAFGRRFDSLQILILPLVFLPALLGAFVGAPVVAREVEAGTHRFFWTQGVTRRRWFASMSAGAVALAAIAGGIYAVIAARWLDVTNQVTEDRFGRMYDFQGVLPLAAAVFAVAVGIASGVAMRRTVPAMAATLGIFVVVRLLVATQLRPRFARPLTLDTAFAGPDSDQLAHSGAWVLSQRTLTASGIEIGRGGSLDLSRIGDACPELDNASPGRLPPQDVVERCLDRIGVHQVTRYHPASRFWSFQLIESGILVALAVAALVVAYRLLPRRAT